MKPIRLPLESLAEVENIRKTYLQEIIDQLAGSLIANGQLVPLLVKSLDPKISRHPIIDGHQRYRAAQQAGLKELNCIIMDVEGVQTIETQLATLCRSDLPPYEQFEAFQGWMVATGGTAKELAAKVGRDPAQISRIMSLGKSIREVKEAAKAGKLSVADWYDISRLPPDEQAGRLLVKLGVKTLPPANADPKPPDPPAASQGSSNKDASIRLDFPGQRSVILRGANSLEGMIELLDEATKECEKASGQGITVKSLVKVLADKSKKPKADKQPKTRKKAESAAS